MPARTLGPERGVDREIPHRLKRGTSANDDTRQCVNEDAGLPTVWSVRSHIGSREEQNIFHKDSTNYQDDVRYDLYLCFSCSKLYSLY